MELKGYVISVICVCVVGSIVTALCPDGERNLSGHVRLAVGIVMIISCLMPIKTLIEGLEELDISDMAQSGEEKASEYESIFENSLVEAEKGEVEAGIRSMLKSGWGIEENECYVSINISEDGEARRIDRVFIKLSGSAIWSDTGQIEQYFNEIFGCEIITAID